MICPKCNKHRLKQPSQEYLRGAADKIYKNWLCPGCGRLEFFRHKNRKLELCA